MKQLRLVNGDLDVQPGGFALVSGQQKVLQDLGILVRDALGSDRFHPRWGTILHEYVSSGVHPEEVALLVRSEITRVIQNYIVMQSDQISSDADNGRRSRFSPDEIVVDVSNIEIQQSYDRLNVRVTVITGRGAAVSVVRTVGMEQA